ncbi:uncharacterized protein EAE97_009123 [Botrytis byssoidea]|uniref:NAD dependent epimerase/dehydratase n=1 Tax=Botrytis byssoidea TaxID=139641 RepID=A0A9P5I6V2_9HELO|nr:uncharacterized protein EAE97_009123 [Botrytis byssoidea]KAF7932102.1 hypothetical protein EAE97_009123 [Botrytis byssoidea]
MTFRTRKIDTLSSITKRERDMQVLCLGLSRTSTMSLQEALNKLGYGTYHCRVAAPTEGHIPLWLEGFDAKLNGNGKSFGREEFDKILTGFSLPDMPAVNFSEELLIAYPDAKVILTTRDPDKWIGSVERSIYAIIHSRLWFILKIVLPEALPFRQLLLTALIDWSNGNLEDRTALRTGFISHNEKIRKLARGRLLEFSPRDEWGTLYVHFWINLFQRHHILM